VAVEGGITRAAAKLNRVQSNISTRVKQLEARLGVTLFRKNGRSLVLTREGDQLLPLATRLLRLADEAEAEMRSGRPSGTFRLGSLESTAGTRLPAILSRYHRAHPAVTIELITSTTGGLIGLLNKFEIDAAFVSEPFSAPGLNALPVFREELVLISGKGVAAIPRPQQFAALTLIAFASGCSYRKRVQEWLGESNVVPRRVLEFASYQAMIACVAAGTGVSIVPRSVLATIKSSPEIRVHELPPKVRRNRTHLLWRDAPTPVLASLIGMLAPFTDAASAAGK
jgi:DNA-binding transcriptional LysR family regulator